LEKTGYVKSRAAKLLGLTLRQLDYRIKKYNIEVKKF
jgi:Nif-specific regulatory protein